MQYLYKEIELMKMNKFIYGILLVLTILGMIFLSLGVYYELEANIIQR